MNAKALRVPVRIVTYVPTPDQALIAELQASEEHGIQLFWRSPTLCSWLQD